MIPIFSFVCGHEPNSWVNWKHKASQIPLIPDNILDGACLETSKLISLIVNTLGKQQPWSIVPNNLSFVSMETKSIFIRAVE